MLTPLKNYSYYYNPPFSFGARLKRNRSPEEIAYMAMRMLQGNGYNMKGYINDRALAVKERLENRIQVARLRVNKYEGDMAKDARMDLWALENLRAGMSVETIQKETRERIFDTLLGRLLEFEEIQKLRKQVLQRLQKTIKSYNIFDERIAHDSKYQIGVRDLKILNLLEKGYSYEQISDILQDGLTANIVNKRMFRIRKEYGAKVFAQ